MTPLHIAAGKNSADIGEILLSNGADINAKDIISSDTIILFWIKITSNIKMWLNHKNMTPLHLAAFHNSKEIGELLISKGADININDINYQFIILYYHKLQ